MKKLTPKQDRFCLEYLIDLNATQAAIRAGYSERSARAAASRNMANVNIQREISGLIAGQVKRAEVSADQIISNLAKIAFADIRKLFDDDGNMKQPTDLDDDTAMTVVSFVAKSTKSEPGTQTIRVRMADRIKALELLGRRLGMFTDRIEHSGNAAAANVMIVVPDNGRQDQ